MVKARSSLGRSNIAVCKCAGFIDSGYYNRITLEITNFSNVPCVLPVGARIGQIVFMYCGNTDNLYYTGDPMTLNGLSNFTPHSSNHGYMLCVTDSTGKVEVRAENSSATFTIDVVAYIN